MCTVIVCNDKLCIDVVQLSTVIVCNDKLCVGVVQLSNVYCDCM